MGTGENSFGEFCVKFNGEVIKAPIKCTELKLMVDVEKAKQFNRWLDEYVENGGSDISEIVNKRNDVFYFEEVSV